MSKEELLSDCATTRASARPRRRPCIGRSEQYESRQVRYSACRSFYILERIEKMRRIADVAAHDGAADVLLVLLEQRLATTPPSAPRGWRSGRPVRSQSLGYPPLPLAFPMARSSFSFGYQGQLHDVFPQILDSSKTPKVGDESVLHSVLIATNRCAVSEHGVPKTDTGGRGGSTTAWRVASCGPQNRAHHLPR